MKIDLSGVQPPTYTPIPPGEYPVDVVQAESRDTSTGNGKGINVQLQVQMGDGNTRTLYDWMNYEHVSQMAQEIGQRRLRSLCDSSGLDAEDFDPDDAVGKRVIARIKIDKRDDSKNEVVVYKPLKADQQPTAQAQPEAAPAKPAEPQLQTRPW